MTDKTMQETAEKGPTAHFPACHLVDPRKSLNTCTACGGSTLLDAPCQPARDVPFLLAEPVSPPGNQGGA